MKQSSKRLSIFLICSLLLLVVGLVLAVRLGSVHIAFSDIFNSIFNYSETLELMLVRDVRIPRALSVLMTGGILGVTGAMIQGVTRNPIAEPSILGVSQGATLVIAIFYAAGIGITTKNVMIASFIGALITGLIVLGFISKKANNNSIAKILLAGTAMSTFFVSLTTVIGLLTNQSQMIGFWVSGGFRNATWADFKLVFIVGIIGLIITMIIGGYMMNTFTFIYVDKKWDYLAYEDIKEEKSMIEVNQKKIIRIGLILAILITILAFVAIIVFKLI